jgi:hypothetical protein
MIRSLLTIPVVGLLCAFVGAQAPSSLTPGQRADLFKKNRTVIKGVIDVTVKSSQSPNDFLKKADGYYPLLVQFNREITQARTDKDPGRIQELTRLLETLLDKGLAPTLEDARRQVEGGTNSENYPVVKSQLLSQLQALSDSLATDEQAKTSIDAARQRLNRIAPPKK